MSATLSTHVLDTAQGRPAAGIAVTLFAIDGAVRTELARAVTNSDGRTDGPIAASLDAGTYELVFAVGAYFAETGTAAFFDLIPVRFVIGASGKYHVPLLLSPWSYSTYRGS
ncbi:MAG: hydroxyisourate hydrolase [Vulcanimicrobiaceae bacterium]|jgi:hydroxyisourate hydrolase